MILNRKNTLKIGLILCILFVIPLTQRVSATFVWTEDFEDPPFDEWYLQGYEDDGVFAPSDCLPTIENGMLQMPNTQIWGNASVAMRNSTLAYGTWSFDWYVNIGTNHASHDVVWLISNMVFNQTGLSQDNPYLYGYAINMNTEIGYIDLYKMTSGVAYNLGVGGDINPPIYGSHHIDVTRTSDGTFYIYFDSEFVYTFTDNSHTTSERFVIASWLGDSAFDNITVSDTVDITTTTTTTTITTSTHGFDWIILLFSLSLILIIFPKRRR
jgi:hypothetical protein